MLLISNALTYPLGTYHYCQDDVHIAVSGFEKHLRVEKSHKKAWNEQELYETCYWSKQYFQTHFGRCTYTQLQDTNLLMKFNSYGCTIASNIDIHSVYTFDNYKLYLEQSCPECYNRLIEVTGIHQVWPLDTTHYCWNGNHVAVKGNDMMLERGDDGFQRKKAWSDYTRQDSCYYIRQYFQGKHKYSCDVNELVPYPVRSHADCFVAINSNVTRSDITTEIQLFLNDKCSLCNGGHYYDPIIDYNNGYVYNTSWLNIMMSMIIICIEEWLFCY